MHSAVQTLCSRLPRFSIHADDSRAVGHEAEPCSICGGDSTRGVPIDDFLSDSLTDQNTFRSPESQHVCVACAFVRARLSPVPGRAPKPCDRCNGTGVEPEPSASVKVIKRAKRKPGETCEKCDGTKVKESGGRYGNFSHFLDDDRCESATKGEKPKILNWLRGPKRGSWFCCVADTGQKHLLPYVPLNPPGSRGRIRFEEQDVALPSAEGWQIVDDACELLTGGVTKEELESGSFGARAWQLCGGRLQDFEAKWSHLRGGAWFSLVCWLAQRDEARVAERIEAEKAAKKEKSSGSKVGRSGRGKTQNASSGDATLVQARVSSDSTSEDTGALENHSRQDAGSGKKFSKRRRVVHADSAMAADSTTGQQNMFDLIGAK